MLSNEQWQNLRQFSAVKEEKKENLIPDICGAILLICYMVAEFLRIIF